MRGRYLLDTNIVIALFGEDAAVLQRLADAQEVFLCSIVLGELHYGARNSVPLTQCSCVTARQPLITVRSRRVCGRQELPFQKTISG